MKKAVTGISSVAYGPFLRSPRRGAQVGLYAVASQLTLAMAPAVARAVATIPKAYCRKAAAYRLTSNSSVLTCSLR
jgi:hypothetical protein